MEDFVRGTMIIADAEKIQYKISRRLNELRKRNAKPKPIDIEYLWHWTHKLYEIARERDRYAQKLLYAKRAFIFAFTEPYDPKKDKKGKENSTMNKSKKLLWGKAYNSDDCFDLRVQNPDDVDKVFLMEFLKNLKKAPAGKNFNKKAYDQFKAWIQNPKEILPEFAFATLDSWSFSEGTNAKNTDKQTAARDLWDALFCVRPDGDRRLTDPNVSGGKKIIKEKFDLWWPKQKDCQKI